MADECTEVKSNPHKESTKRTRAKNLGFGIPALSAIRRMDLSAASLLDIVIQCRNSVAQRFLIPQRREHERPRYRQLVTTFT